MDEVQDYDKKMDELVSEIEKLPEKIMIDSKKLKREFVQKWYLIIFVKFAKLNAEIESCENFTDIEKNIYLSVLRSEQKEVLNMLLKIIDEA